MASPPLSIPGPDPALQDLARALHLARGSFALFFAACNDPAWRDRAIEDISHLAAGFITAPCTVDTQDPLDAVPAHTGQLTGIHLTRLELAVPADESNLAPLRRLNLHRARWQQFGCPIVIWVPEYLLGLLLRHAPDFGNWRSGSLHFNAPPGISLSGPSRSFSSSEKTMTPQEFQAASERDARIAELTTRLQSQIQPGASVADLHQAQWCRELALHLARAGAVAQAQHWQHLAMTWESPAYQDDSKAGDWLDFGDALLQGGSLAAAKDAYTEGHGIFDRLAASEPANAWAQRNLSVSLNNLGDLAVAQGDLAGALRSFTEAKVIAERLAASDPANAGWQRDLSVSLNKLGDLAVAQGNLAGALRSYTESQTIRERLAASAPANAELQRCLSVSLIKLGELAVAQGDLAGALRSFTESKAIFERLAASDPAHVKWQRDLSVSLEKLGDLAVAQGDLAGASRYFTEDKAIAERLAASDPANAEWQRDLSISLDRLGDLAVTQGDLAGALRSYTESKTIAERLAASEPANAAWQRDLSQSCYLIAVKVFQPQECWAEALELMERCLCISERLAAADPTNVTWQNDARVSRKLVAELRAKVK